MSHTYPTTPRDRLDRLFDYFRKATRYWWLVAIAVVLGGVLSTVFAVTRPPLFKSWSVLFYQERIQSSLLSGQAEGDSVQRNIGDRYRELLLARSQLGKIIADPKLAPSPAVLKKAGGPEGAIEALREQVTFEVRGANTFRISYVDPDRDRAQAITQKLTELLQQKEEEIRFDQAKATVEFAESQKAAAASDLRDNQKKLAEFLTKHPEFAADTTNGGNEGAGVRAAAKAKPASGGESARAYALERQRERIKARLAAPVDATAVVHTPAAPTPERLAAEAAVADAQREVTDDSRALEEVRAKFTDKHPDVVKAQDNLAAAQQRLRRAQAAVPADSSDDDVVVAPTSQADRVELQKELSTIEQQLAAERARGNAAQPAAAAAAAAAADDATNWVVQLETQYADLRRAVEEQRDRVQSLSDSVSRAQLEAGQQAAEQGSRLTVVDPAFRPLKPFGKATKLLALAGLALFFGLGMALAMGLAIIDDRLYRRADIEELELAPVLAVIPAAKGRRVDKQPRGRAQTDVV